MFISSCSVCVCVCRRTWGSLSVRDHVCWRASMSRWWKIQITPWTRMNWRTWLLFRGACDTIYRAGMQKWESRRLQYSSRLLRVLGLFLSLLSCSGQVCFCMHNETQQDDPPGQDYTANLHAHVKKTVITDRNVLKPSSTHMTFQWSSILESGCVCLLISTGACCQLLLCRCGYICLRFLFMDTVKHTAWDFKTITAGRTKTNYLYCLGVTFDLVSALCMLSHMI